MSGFKACAAVTAPRRLNSSCTENTRCSVGPLGGALQCARDLQHHGAAGAVVDRGADDAVVGELQHVRSIDDRRADHHAGGGNLRRAAVAAIDVEVGVRQDLVFLLRLGGVVALVGDDAGVVLPLPADTRTDWEGSAFSGTPPTRSTRSRPLASILRTTSPSWSMCANSMTEGSALSPGKVAIRLPMRSLWSDAELLELLCQQAAHVPHDR